MCVNNYLCTVQRRRMISFAWNQSADNVHPAFSVAHFIKNQNERSVNAALTQGERSVNAQWTQNARRPRSVSTLGGRRANTGQAGSRNSQDADWSQTGRRPDTQWPGSALNSETNHQSSRASSNRMSITLNAVFWIKWSVISTHCSINSTMQTNDFSKRALSPRTTRTALPTELHVVQQML